MSEEQVRRFLGDIAGDSSLASELSPRGETLEEQVSALAQDAAGRGYRFTTEEFMAIAETLRKAESAELEDARLEKVAGGITFFDARSTRANLYSFLSRFSFRSPAGP